MNSIPEVPGIRDHFPSGAVREGICRDGSWVLMEFNLQDGQDLIRWKVGRGYKEVGSRNVEVEEKCDIWKANKKLVRLE